MAKKVKVGFFGLTSCAGCLLSFLFTEHNLLQFLENLDIRTFAMIGKEKVVNEYDIAFIEGSVVTEEEVEEVKQIRKKSKIVIALGTCATYGGVPAIKNIGYSEKGYKKAVPLHMEQACDIGQVSVNGIGYYIDVDYYLRGCPPEKEEIIKLTKDIIMGKKVCRNTDYPVCKECRENGNVCLLQEGKDCIGPVTYGGCDSKCPNLGVPCFGCRGPLDDSNVDALVELFKKHKISPDDIRRMFVKFAATSKIFRTKVISKEETDDKKDKA